LCRVKLELREKERNREREAEKGKEGKGNTQGEGVCEANLILRTVKGGGKEKRGEVSKALKEA